MGKYDGLGTFLRRWKSRNDADGVELNFEHIERLIGGYLPRGATDALWWHPGDDAAMKVDDAAMKAPHHRAWLDAGFDALAEPKTERVYFRRRRA